MNIQVINIEYSVISNEYPVDLQRISDRIIKCYNIQSNVKICVCRVFDKFWQRLVKFVSS